MTSPLTSVLLLFHSESVSAWVLLISFDLQTMNSSCPESEVSSTHPDSQTMVKSLPCVSTTDHSQPDLTSTAHLKFCPQRKLSSDQQSVFDQLTHQVQEKCQTDPDWAAQRAWLLGNASDCNRERPLGMVYEWVWFNLAFERWRLDCIGPTSGILYHYVPKRMMIYSMLHPTCWCDLLDLKSGLVVDGEGGWSQLVDGWSDGSDEKCTWWSVKWWSGMMIKYQLRVRLKQINK